MFFKVKKGLDIPLRGRPDERIDVAKPVSSVAILGEDYIGLKPTMLVKEGERVKLGTPVLEDKKNPGVIVTSPASGTVRAVNRGARRVLQSVVIDVDGDEAEEVDGVSGVDLTTVAEAQVRSVLQKTGLWTSFRTRPYGKVPAIESKPNSIFVTAIDTNPLAVEPAVIINERAADYATGIKVLSKLGVPLYVCQSDNAKMASVENPGVKVATFAGKHPAGLASTHVHYIDPVSANKIVWTIGYQDVIAIGSLFSTGQLDARRYVAIAGPLVNSPRVFETRAGAQVSELLEGRVVQDKAMRAISGSVLNGHAAIDAFDYLGRYDNQISVLEESKERAFMGWIAPGLNRFSASNVFVSNFVKPKNYDISTSQYGSPRALVPIGVFERVMPLDILPTPLVRSILVKDTDSAQQLGCLELVEEDLSLLSFVDPGKHDFGPVLRSTLTQIEKEG